ncbi:MAG: putative Ig domain-containing protein [Psychrobium sp.]
MNLHQRAYFLMQRLFLIIGIVAISACNDGPETNQSKAKPTTPDLAANAVGVFKVIDDDKQPISAALFVLEVENDAPISLGVSNVEGNFSSQVFPKGKSANLTVSKDGFLNTVISYDAIPNLNTLELQNVVLTSSTPKPEPTTSSASFVLNDNNGQVLSSASVTLSIEQQAPINIGNTDSEGKFTYSDFPNGKSVKVTFSKSGYLPQSIEFNVPEKSQTLAPKSLTLKQEVLEPTTSTASFFIQTPQGVAIDDASLTLNVADAQPVSLGKTDEQGFLTSNMFPNGSSVSIAVTKSGFANQVIQFEVPKTTQQLSPQTITLLERVAAKIFDGSQDSEVKGDDGAQVNVKGNAFENAQGETVSGDIKLHITPVDVSNDSAEQGGFPGSFSGVTDDDETVNIVTYGTTEFVFTDDNGNELQLKDGETADILLPIYLTQHMDGTAIKAGDKIPLWHLNEETGIWIQEGEGEVVVSSSSPTGWALSGTVSHFTWWNVDVAPPEQQEGLTFELDIDTKLDNNYRVTYSVAPLNGRASSAIDSFEVTNEQVKAGTIVNAYPVFMNIQLIVDIYIDRLIDDDGSFIPVYRETRSIRVPRNIPKTIAIDIEDTQEAPKVFLLDDEPRESRPSVDGSMKMFDGKFNKVKFLGTENFVVCIDCSEQGKLKVTVVESDISDEQWQDLKIKFDYQDRHFSLLGELAYRPQPYSMTLKISDGANNEVTTEPILIQVVGTPTLSFTNDSIDLKVGDELSWQDIVVNQGRAPFKYFIESVSDADQLTSAIDNLIFSSQGALTGTAASPLSDLKMTFYVVDANGLQSPVSVPLTINIESVGVAPSFTNVSSSASLKLNDSWQSTSELSGSPVTSYEVDGELPRGLSLNSDTGVISGDITVVGQYSFSLVAKNEFGQASKSFSLDVAIPTLTQGEAFSFALNDYTQGVDTAWTLTGELPAGLAFDSATGEFSGISYATGNFPITLTQGDNFTVKLTLALQSVDNQAPEITSLSPLSVIHGRETKLTVNATDPENGPLTYAVSIVDSVTGVALTDKDSETPSIDVDLSVLANTQVKIKVKVSDRFGVETEETFDISVAQQPVTLGLQAAHLPTAEPFRIRQYDDVCYLIGGRDNDIFTLGIDNKWQRTANQGTEEINQFSMTDVIKLSNGTVLWAGENRLNTAAAGLGKLNDDGTLESFANLPVIDNGKHAAFSTLLSNGSTVIAAGHNQILYSSNDGDTWLRSDMTAGASPVISSDKHSFTILDGIYAAGKFTLVGEFADITNSSDRKAGYLVISSSDNGQTWTTVLSHLRTIPADTREDDGEFFNSPPPPKFGPQRIGEITNNTSVHNGRLNAIAFDSTSNKFVAVGSPQYIGYVDGLEILTEYAVYTSDDGVAWTIQPSPTRSADSSEKEDNYLSRTGLSSVASHPTFGWLATDNSLSNGRGLISSSDGQSWKTEQQIALNSIARCDNGQEQRWIAAGNNYNEIVINDTEVTVNNQQNAIAIQKTFVTNNNTTYTAFGYEIPSEDSIMLRSMDSGQTWSRTPITITDVQGGPDVEFVNLVKINDQSWLSLGSALHHSSDGANWTTITSPFTVNGKAAYLFQFFSSDNKAHIILEQSDNFGNVTLFHRTTTNGSIWSDPVAIDIGQFSGFTHASLQFSESSLAPWRMTNVDSNQSLAINVANEIDSWDLISQDVCSNAAECDINEVNVRATSLSATELFTMQYAENRSDELDKICFNSALTWWKKQEDNSWLSTVTNLASVTRNQGCNDEHPAQVKVRNHKNGALVELRTENGRNSYFSNNKTQWRSFSFANFQLQHVEYTPTAVLATIDTADSGQFLFKHSASLYRVANHQLVVVEAE